MAYTSATGVGNFLQTTFSGSTTPTSATVADFISWADAEIERRTGQKFSSTTITNQVFDIDRFNTFPDVDIYGSLGGDPRIDASSLNGYKFFLPAKYRPMITYSTVSRNTASPTEADSWSALTHNSGSGGDFVDNLEEGSITFIQNAPRMGKRAIRISGTYGYTSTPSEVIRLSTLLAAKEVLMSSLTKNQVDNWDNVSIADLSQTKASGENVRLLQHINAEIDRQWEVVGRMYSFLV